MELATFHLAHIVLIVIVSWTVFVSWRASMFTLGYHGVMCVGAYSAAFVIKMLELNGPSAFGFALTLLASMVGGLLFGSLLIIVFSKVGSDYYAVGTLAAAEMMRVIFSNWNYLGGSLGFQTEDLIPFVSNRAAIYGCLFLVGVFFLSIAFIWHARVLKSYFGLSITAVNQDMDAAEYMGVNGRSLRFWVFSLSSMFAGVAGGLLLHINRAIIPSDFSFVSQINILLVVILARTRQMMLLVWGTAIYGLGEVIRSNILGMDPAFSAYREMFFSAILLLILIGPAIFNMLKRHFLGGRTLMSGSR